MRIRQIFVSVGSRDRGDVTIISSIQGIEEISCGRPSWFALTHRADHLCLSRVTLSKSKLVPEEPTLLNYLQFPHLSVAHCHFCSFSSVDSLCVPSLVGGFGDEGVSSSLVLMRLLGHVGLTHSWTCGWWSR